MIFDRNESKEVIALLGAGSMGTAIVRRIAAGRKILLGDISEKNLEQVSHDFRYSGYDVETMSVNALEKDSVEAFAEKAASLGDVKYFIDTAGASPNQASPEHILKLDMVGTGYALDAFGKVMAVGGAGLVISSQTGYMYPIPNEIELQILKTPTEELMDLPFIKETAYQRSGIAYIRDFRKIRFHDLRHSCASLLSNGIPMKQIQEWLGHSDFSTTANIYSHLEYSSKLISADSISQSLDS